MRYRLTQKAKSVDSSGAFDPARGLLVVTVKWWFC